MNQHTNPNRRSLQELRLTSLQAIAVALITATGGAATAWIGKSSMETREKAQLAETIKKQSDDLTLAKQVADDYGKEILKLKHALVEKEAELDGIRQARTRSDETMRGLQSVAAELKDARDKLARAPWIFVQTFSWSKGDDRCRTVAAQAITRAGGAGIRMYDLSVGGVRDDTQFRIVCAKPTYLLIVSVGPSSSSANAEARQKAIREKLDELLAKESRSG